MFHSKNILNYYSSFAHWERGKGREQNFLIWMRKRQDETSGE